MLSSRFDQGVAEKLVVRLCGKNRLAVVAPLDDMTWSSDFGHPS
jgi:hypothetical protein